MAQLPHDPLGWIDEELHALAAQGLLRGRSERVGPQGPVLTIEGRQFVNFGSNDYLSLADDPRLRQAAADCLRHEGWGAGASPLIVGRSRAQAELEARLAEFEGTEAALVFSSGYAANLGAVAALVGSEDAVFSDRWNHASLIDGCRLSRAKVHVFPHADCAALAAMLHEARGYRRRLIVTDSLFSMDGDLAPLAELCELADAHQAMLLVDEAHATGVFGERGRGVAERLGVEQRVNIKMGTLSKALGSVGGFACGSRQLVDWLTNRARSYFFSTAPPAAACRAASAAVEIVDSEPQRRRDLLAKAAALREALRGAGWDIGRSSSQIIPLIVGDARTALGLATTLKRHGLLVPAIRPPSVPEGTARLRIGIAHGHTPEMIRQLSECLGRPG